MKNSLMNRNRGYDLFDGFFDDMFADPFFTSSNNIMRTDITEKDGNYILDIELPGFKKEDVNLNLENGYLTISAKREHKVDNEDRKENFVRRERSFGQFSRSFYVGDVEQDEIEAHLENGILTIKLPKEEEKKAKSNRIEIK